MPAGIREAVTGQWGTLLDSIGLMVLGLVYPWGDGVMHLMPLAFLFLYLQLCGYISAYEASKR